MMEQTRAVTGVASKQSSHQFASDSMLKTHMMSSGTSLGSKGKLISQQATGTLKTIKSLKDQLSRINNIGNELTDGQLKELVKLGNIISDKVTANDSTLHNSFARAYAANYT